MFRCQKCPTKVKEIWHLKRSSKTKRPKNVSITQPQVDLASLTEREIGNKKCPFKDSLQNVKSNNNIYCFSHLQFNKYLSPYNILISIYHCTKKELTCFLFEQDRELWKQKKYFQRGGLMDYFCHLQFYKHYFCHYNILIPIYHCTKKEQKCLLFALIILLISCMVCADSSLLLSRIHYYTSSE